MTRSSVGNNSSVTNLTTDDFTNHEAVKKCISILNETFPGGDKPLIVSDVLDNEGHQYVNLVQKGGGVLGVALVGYTYILEQMGIRFLRLAGTSAGAINTALMTVTGKKEEAKSSEILKSICGLNFFNLVDGHPAAKFVIRSFITNKNFSNKVKNYLSAVFIILGILVLGDVTFLGLENKFPSLSLVTRILFVVTGFYLLLLGCIIYYITTLFKRLKNSGYGINPGDYLYDWIKQQLIANGVNTVSDLNKKVAAPVPGIKLRVPHPDGVQGLKGEVTFITSELVTQNKIQFPDMCFLFREKANIDTLQPAGFIRASMSIPVFFESYMISDIPCDTDEIKKAWLDTFGEKDPPTTARFVDGGILSNFPINIFYNPKIIVPRLPSFGIDLDDTKPGEETRHAESWSLSGYFGRMFNTIRFYYDKDFLLKNRLYEKGIGKIPLAKYNWLNFFIKDQDKIDMFVLGAQAATQFLLKFDWEGYKGERSDMQLKLNTQKPPAKPVTST